jgi:hypothetical protein
MKQSKHALSERGDDFYASPAEAVTSLIRIENQRLPRTLLEPACGDGAIVLPFRDAGYTMFASDLVNRGCPNSETGVDFLMPFPVPSGIGGIVTNPPFKLAMPFIEKALSIVPYVAVLLRLSFLESTSRKEFFQTSPLARVHIASRRLPMMHRHGWAGPVASSSTPYAWFCWDRKHNGPPNIFWFDWAD